MVLEKIFAASFIVVLGFVVLKGSYLFCHPKGADVYWNKAWWESRAIFINWLNKLTNNLFHRHEVRGRADHQDANAVG